MASILKAQKVNESKRQGKRKADDLDVDGDVPMSTTVNGVGEEEGEGKVVKKVKRNKQRVLLLSSRGITHRMRHLMNDLEALLPHVKKGEFVGRLFLGQALTIVFYLCTYVSV